MDAINLYVLCQAIDLDNFGDYKDTLTKSGNKVSGKERGNNNSEIFSVRIAIKENTNELFG